jgi:hypothetical protein
MDILPRRAQELNDIPALLANRNMIVDTLQKQNEKDLIKNARDKALSDKLLMTPNFSNLQQQNLTNQQISDRLLGTNSFNNPNPTTNNTQLTNRLLGINTFNGG